ncbi:putative toxin-antitoxin system toxin component, PIN family [Aromatoleum anaerobium]|uniref:Toxin-antitoxin system toxin component, PIN family n=1 Tax=Aromatoleum anaerobium TaxID=182180 RepID=A0ABX1PR43_9RHOO|nr:putative toxin-antitoxin system toxin component, PIN family [Aromatoleum anaerobium]MCK0505364.1 putative toxin-antitoxin system toxin component, PIN family [Aromatoleum anaerobium]
MRVVLDTNILIAALITKDTPPDRAYQSWRAGEFTLLSCDQQLEEIRRVTRREGVRFRIRPMEAGRMVNDLRKLAMMLEKLPVVEVSPDPYDNYLVAMAMAGDADYLVTGDKRDLLALECHGRTRIVPVRTFIGLRES